MVKNIITIRKEGLFYSVFDDDALIFNYLFGYKIINNRCGFPENAFNKVVNILYEKNISYTINDEKVDFKNKNKYKHYLTKAIDKNKINEKIEKLKDKIERLKEEDLFDLLNKIEDIINEY